MNNRAVLGFVLSAVVTAVGATILTPAVHGDPVALMGMTLLFLVYSVVAIFLFAVPAFLALNHAGWVRWWSAIGAGFVIGAIVGIVVVLPNRPQLQGLLPMASLGALSGLAFWLVWRGGHAA